jgi:hypothetical protein
MTSLLASCAHWTQPPVAVEFPDRPAHFGTPVPPPPVIIGESKGVFALKNRKALHEANARLDADRAYDDDIRATFGAKR